jgi:uncharacterized protein YkwD
MMHWLTAAAVVLSLTSGLRAGPASAAAGDGQRLVELINGERTARGLVALVPDARLMTTAGDYAWALAGGDPLSHTGAGREGPVARAETHGYLGWTVLGESLAAGHPTAEAVVAAWLASPSHRATLLSRDACEIGVGQATSAESAYGVYWVAEVGC